MTRAIYESLCDLYIFLSKVFSIICRADVRSAMTPLLAACVLIGWTAAVADTQYYYDDLGRLVQAVDSSGSTVQYDYDANGNLLSINRINSSQLFISNVSPLIVHAGNIVTVTGTGFSSTPAQNEVSIAGFPVSVNSSSLTTLQFTVPLGAASGPIFVTNAGGTVSSADHLVVQYPALSSLSPTVANPGSSVTLSGQFLNFSPSTTSISVAGVNAPISSISSNNIVFSAPSVSGTGAVVMSASYGSATSPIPLTVVPSAINAANVTSYGVLVSGAPAHSLSVPSTGKYAVLEFDATAGQWYSLQIKALSVVPSGGSVSYVVYSPSGTVFSSGSMSSANGSIHLPVTPAAGKYVVSFGSGTNTSVQLQAQLILNPTMSADGSPISALTTAGGQSLRYAFSGTAGQNVGLAISNLVSAPSYVNVLVTKPDGSSLWSATYCYVSNGGCQVQFRNLPATGTYLVRVAPSGQNTMSFNLTLSTPVTGSLAVGSPQPVSLVPGQYTLLTFTNASAQTVAVNINSMGTTPSGKEMTAYVYNPAGTEISSAIFSGANKTLNLYNLAAGTYTVLIVSRYPNITAATMQVSLVAGITGTLTADSSTVSTGTTVPGQNVYYTFAATAGQNVGLAISNLVSSPSYVNVLVTKPDGSSLWSATYCYVSNGGCQVQFRNLLATGTYLVRVAPSGQNTMSFNLTLSTPVTGSLVVGSPQPVSLVPGQYTLLTFASSAGQSATVGVTAMTTTPSGRTMYIYIYNPSGTQVSSTSFTSANKSVSLSGLVAGEYTVLITPRYPNITAASMQVTWQ